jgi:lipopolysaccharide exporter
LAYTISNLSATEITRLISHVTFPAYSRIRHDPGRLAAAYLTVSKLNAFIAIPIAGGIAVLGKEFIGLFLGSKWMPMAPAMQVLALWGCIRSIGASTGPIFYSLGRPEVATRLQFLQLILLIALIYPLSAGFGILGTSLAVTLACLPPNFLAIRAVFKILKSGLGLFCRDILDPTIAAGVAVFALTWLKTLPPVGVTQTLFVCYGAAYLVVYLGVLWLLDRFTEYRMDTVVRAIAEGLQK